MPADLLDCMHCGLCLQSCPTYLETGNEIDSPRGRIYLMRAIDEGRLTIAAPDLAPLNRCLDCRGCESACPSGVKYAQLLEPFRVRQRRQGLHASSGRLTEFMLQRVLPDRRRLRRWLRPLRWAQGLRLDRMASALGLPRLLPSRLRRLVTSVPTLQPHRRDMPEHLPAHGEVRGRVGLLLGCAAEAMFPDTNRAIAHVLQANGYEVVVPSEQGCCGALAWHEGRAADARDHLLALAEAFRRQEPLDAVVANAAGCGAMLQEATEIGAVLDLRPDQAESLTWLAEHSLDVHSFLHREGPRPPARQLSLQVAYDDACHLVHAQKESEAPRALLQAIGVDLLPVEESTLCCGAAGSYSLHQPELSIRLGERKAEHLIASGAEIVATANVGCAIQIERSLRRAGSRLPVVHPLQLLDQAYRT